MELKTEGHSRYTVANKYGLHLGADLLAMHPSARGYRGSWIPNSRDAVWFPNRRDADHYCDALRGEGFTDIAVVEVLQ